MKLYRKLDGDNAGKRSQLLTFMPAQRMHSAFVPKPALRTLLTGLPNGAGSSWMLVTKIVACRDRPASVCHTVVWVLASCNFLVQTDT